MKQPLGGTSPREATAKASVIALRQARTVAMDELLGDTKALVQWMTEQDVEMTTICLGRVRASIKKVEEVTQ